MIAALGDFDVGEMFGREPETRCRVVGNISGPRLDLDERAVALALAKWRANSLFFADRARPGAAAETCIFSRRRAKAC